MKLDRTVASRLPLPADRYKPDVIYFDRALPGFGLRIRARKRTFIVQYRCCAGKTRRLLLGAETDKFNVTVARKAADTVLAKVKLGHDPQGEKAAARTKDKDQKTFGAIVDMYLEDKRGRVRGRTFREIERYLRTAWKPLHRKALGKIEREDVAVALRKIAGKSGNVAADRARSALMTFFAWGMGEGLIKENPAIGTNRPAQPASRERVLADTVLAKLP